MTISTTIPANIEDQTGFAFAAIVNDEVIALRSLNIGDAAELTEIDAPAEISALNEHDAVKQAYAADKAAWAAYEESGYDDDAVDYDSAALTIRFGMVSGGEFTHTFSKNEAKRARLPKGWQ